jgi:hypothetical protein
MAKKINYNVFEKSDVEIMTNHLDISINEDAFFSRFAIVSYFIKGKGKNRNLSYEQLSDVPCLAVFGKYGVWNIEKQSRYTKFFVLCRKGHDADSVLDSLKCHSDVVAGLDSLDKVSEDNRKHVIASLLLNSLGTDGKGKNRYMFNDARLLLWDERNFLHKFKKSQEIVCLQISINDYFNLIAQTCTLSRVTDLSTLKKHSKRAFKADYDIEGAFWAGRSVRPVKIEMNKRYDLEKEKLFIQKKRFGDTKNLVPYWPYDRENYRHGKLFAVWQAVQSVNEKYEGIAALSFHRFEVFSEGVFHTEKIANELINTNLVGKKIRIDNPLTDEYSREYAMSLKTSLEEHLPHDSSVYLDSSRPSKKTNPDVVIKIVEEKDSDGVDHYERDWNRYNNPYPVQHVVCHRNKMKDKLIPATIRRILLELVVKIANKRQKMPESLVDKVQGWSFIEYRRNSDSIVGARMEVAPDGEIRFKELGLLTSTGYVPFEDFIRQTLRYHTPEKLKGSQDYKVMIKDNNVYLILDTDEVPMLDAEKIENGYDKVQQGETLSFFKRNENAPYYFAGYKGLHVWRTRDLDDHEDGAFSFIAGSNGKSIRMMDSEVLDRLPRARRIFPLHLEHPEALDSDVEEILVMLNNGFGRWNELMTYPYPFKFLYEHLDDSAETSFSMHWSEITATKELVNMNIYGQL